MDIANCEQAKAALAAFRSTHPRDFDALFREHRAVGTVPDEVAILPIIIAESDGYRSDCMLFPWEGEFFACDWRGAMTNEVFRPHPDEVAVCAERYLPAKEGTSVLDVGTGCGIYGIRARNLANAVVTARDVNPRAIALARRNALWNGAGGVSFEVANLFDGLTPAYDLVILGLPYQPTPGRGGAKTYSYGGDDGSSLIRSALSRLDTVLAEKGTSVACCASLGTSARAAIVEELPDLLPSGGWHAQVATLPGTLSVRDWWQLKFTRTMTEHEQLWVERLEADGRGWFHYCVIRVTLLSRQARHRVEVDLRELPSEMTTERLLSRLT
jgi:methylase of polypeptide subunit release factors